MNDTRPQTEGARSFEAPKSAPAPLTSDMLLQMLVSLRGAAIPPEQKTVLRDLVLEYSQTHDPVRKEQIAAKLSAAIEPHKNVLGVQLPDASPETTQTSVKSDPVVTTESVAGPTAFGHTRMQPVFSSPDAQAATVSAEPPKPPTPAEPETVQSTPPHVQQPLQQREPEQMPQKNVQAEAAAPAPSVTGDPKHRIAEIKRAVNERVGNPVNIIDRDPAVGREYMAALLDAIKHSSGAGGGGMNTVMDRLEKAFAAVERVLDAPPTAQPESTNATTTTSQPSAPVPPKRDVPQTPIVPDTREAQPPVADRPPQMSVPASIPQQPKKQEHIPPRVPLTEEQSATSIQSTAQTAALKPLSATENNEPLKNRIAQSRAVEQRPVVDIQTPTRRAPASDVRSLQQNNDAALNTSEITDGLQQLLSEWRLFRSSGIFGTGPRGMDHPLYKKVANLPMAALIAGRFEGATPDVKQNIADYMNGWRYEHGIVHKMEEHFEHYLRRVIRHILDQQKLNKKQSSQNEVASKKH